MTLTSVFTWTVGAIASCTAVHLGLFTFWPGYEQALAGAANGIRETFGFAATAVAHNHGPGFGGAAINTVIDNSMEGLYR